MYLLDGDQINTHFGSADAREAEKLDPYVPRAEGDTRPWWERVAEFGLTRAIDSHYGPAAPNKTSAPASFAGENGQTYVQAYGTSGAPVSASSSGMSQTMLLILGVLAVAGVALFATRK